MLLLIVDIAVPVAIVDGDTPTPATEQWYFLVSTTITKRMQQQKILPTVVQWETKHKTMELF